MNNLSMSGLIESGTFESDVHIESLVLTNSSVGKTLIN